MGKSKPKSKERPRSSPPAKPKTPAKILQHPSAASRPPSKPPVVSSKAPKREYPDWTEIPSLRKSDFREVLLRRQKYKAQEKVAKVELESEGGLNDQLAVALLGAGLDPANKDAVICDEWKAAPREGHTATRIDADLLRKELLNHLELEQIEEILEACTEGGDPYTYAEVRAVKGGDNE